MKVIYIECNKISNVNFDDHLKIYDYYKKYDYSRDYEDKITCDFGKGIKTYQMARCIFIDKAAFTVTYIVAIEIEPLKFTDNKEFESVSLSKSNLYQEKADFESMEFLESHEYDRFERSKSKSSHIYYNFLRFIDKFIDFIRSSCSCRCM